MFTTKWVAVLMVAVAIAAFGEMTRTYSAFGGEDVLALLLIGYVAYRMLKGEENA